jgi:hypothetical protein
LKTHDWNLTQEDNKFLMSQGTYFNAPTDDIIEGYKKDDEEIKMVLRFMNEHEMSLYFDIVD